MEYHEAANFLFDLRRYPSRTGVDPTRRLLDHFEAPDERFESIQIGGSNGKGSTARMVESVLRESGYDVGLYTSPHLDDLRERVRINGRAVTESAVCEYVADLEPYVIEQTPDGEPPTFFEAMTGLAVRAFYRADVDIAIFEVGIGGKHDATSALSPDAAAVTNVTLEHADLLGDTIEEIARDKAAIAPDSRPLVTAATGEAVETIAESVGGTIRVGTGGEFDIAVEDGGRVGIEQAVTIDAPDTHIETAIPLLGSHQCLNAGIAVALCRQLADVSPTDVERGLRNAHWPGRFEVMAREPLVVLDGAHNPGGCDGLAGTLSTFEYDDLHLVFGAMAEKDHAEMVAALPAADAVYTCRPSLPRAETADSLAAVFETDGRAGTIKAVDAVADAVDSARTAADPGDAVVICGSLFAVAEARRLWTPSHITKQARDLDTSAAVLRTANVAEGDVQRRRGSGDHHVVETRARPKQADRLERELLAAGGECARSAVDAEPYEPDEVVLMGTRSQFERVIESIEGAKDGLSIVANELETELRRRDENKGHPWAAGTAVMGILNVTPDSFYDGGRYEALEAALDRAERLIEAGADIIDIGGESTRPGADPVSVEAEIDRVIPVIEELADEEIDISVDTRKAAVARAALDAGADILNDVSGLEDPEMRLVAAEYDVPVIVMHSIQTPVDPNVDIEYDDVVSETIDALAERVLLAEKAGLDRSRIIVDPGLGFGKTATESFELLDRLGEFRSLGCPVLVGHSRKSMFGLVDQGGSDDRLASTVAASALAAERGADIVRVHDVAENVAAVKTAAATRNPERFG
jgi:dihydropteroate synthase